MKQLGGIALGLGIAPWVIMILNMAVPFVGCLIGPFAPICAVAAIVVGIMSLKTEGRQLGQIGLWLGVAYLVIFIIMTIVGLVIGLGVLCFYFGFLALIFGGAGCCSSYIQIAFPLTLLAFLGVVRIMRK